MYNGALILNTPFIYPTQLIPIVTPDGTTAHANSNMRITHTNKVRLCRKVTGFKQALTQQIFAIVKVAYLTDIHNCTTNSIHSTVADVLNHLQENCGQLMPHELLEHEEIIKKMTCHPRYLIMTILYGLEELLQFYDITVTSYTKHQVVNIA